MMKEKNLLFASKTRKNGNFLKREVVVSFGFCNRNFLSSKQQMGKVSTNSVNTHPLAKWSGSATPKRNKPIIIIKKKNRKK